MLSGYAQAMTLVPHTRHESLGRYSPHVRKTKTPHRQAERAKCGFSPRCRDAPHGMEPPEDTPKLTSVQWRGEQASLHRAEKRVGWDAGVAWGRKPHPRWLKRGGVCRPKPGRSVLASFAGLGTQILSLGPGYFPALLSVQCSCRRLQP